MNRILQVVLTGNNASLKSVLTQSAAEVRAFGNSVEQSNRRAAASGGLVADSMKAVAAAGLVTAAALGYAVVKAAQFESSMRNVNSLAGLTEGGLKSLSSEVLALSTVLPQSANTLAEGLYDVIGSGFEAADALTVLKAAAAAASAGLTTTEVAAKAIGGVLNAYGLEAKDAADVSDILFQTVNLGVLSFDELAGSIGDTVGTAAAAKVGIDQVGAAIATMTLTGINGAEASTSLNNLLQSMLQPSEALAAKYKELGYASGEQALKADGLRGVMDKLRVSTGGNVTELLNLFPNIRAARGALALMSAEGQNYARVSGELEDKNARQGATARVLAEQMKGAAAQFQLLKNGAESTAISLGSKVLPALMGLMAAVGQLGGFVGDVAADIGHRLEPAWGLLVRTATSLWEVLGEIYDAGAPIVGALLAVGGGAVVGALGLLLTVLANGAEFLAENKTLALALAAVLAVQLAGGIGAVQVALWRFVGTPVILFFSSILSGATAVGALFSGGFVAAAGAARVALMGLITAAAPLAAIGAIVYGISKIVDIKSAAGDAREEIAGMWEAIDNAKGNTAKLEATVSVIDDLKSKVGELREKLSDDGAWETTILGAMITGSAEDKEKLEEYEKALDRAKDAQGRVLDSTRILSNEFNTSRDRVMELADKYGIDLTGAVSESIRLFQNYQAMAVEDDKDVQVQKLIDAMGVLADETSTAADRVDALKTALDLLGGKEISIFEATSALEEAVSKATGAVTGLDGAVLNANGGLNAHTEAGRAAGAVLVDIREKGDDLIATMVEQGSTFEEVQAANNDLRASFIKAAGEMGITGQAAETLADSVLGIPSEREVRIKASMSDAAAKIEQIRLQLAGLKDKTVAVQIAAVTGRTVANAQWLIDRVGQAEGGINGRGGVPTHLSAYRAGGLHSFADGGTLPSVAGVARDGANLVQWAEPGTGGEAFVPLGDRNAPRSQELVRWLYSYFFPEANRRFASGGVSGTAGRYTTSVPSSAYAPAAPEVTTYVEADVRVMMGTRDITDIVDIQVDHKLKKTAQGARAAGAGR